jgi:hypothetical protein
MESFQETLQTLPGLFVAAQGNDRPSLPCMTTLQPPKPGRLAAFLA